MSSYAKRMFEMTASWLEANPTPGDTFLHVPRKKRFPTASATNEEQRVGDAMIEDALVIAREEGIPEDDTKRFILAHLIRSGVVKGKEQALEDSMPPSIRALGPATSARLRAAIQKHLDAFEAERERLRNELDQAFTNMVPIPGITKVRLVEDIEDVWLGRWSLAWGRGGHNVFELSQDFVASMLLTDPRGLDFERVAMPFSGMLVLVPSGFIKDADGGDYTKLHICELPRVTEENVASALKEFSGNGLELDGPPGPVETGIFIQATDGVRFISMMIEHKELATKGWKAIEDLPDHLTTTEDQQAMATIRQLVFGMLAYINADRSAVTPREIQRKKPKPKQDRNQGGTRPEEVGLSHWEVSRTLKLDPRLVKLARGGSREIAFQIKHRYVVRGHYRNQAIGYQRQDRRVIWIAPFWKGPEDGAAIMHVYKIDTNKAATP